MYFEFPISRMLVELDRNDLLPAIVFRTARRQCDQDVERLAATRVGQVSNERRSQINMAIETVITKHGLDPEVIRKHPHYGPLLQTAVGAHHAGQLLAWRLLLEELMSAGLLRIMVATGTVAAGVDFPARTVIITAHSKRGSDGFRVLTASELQQMSGRAGRRGKDAIGIALVAPGPYSDARVIHEVSQQPPEPLKSAYFPAPATVLNLLKYRNVDELRYLVSRSLAAFSDRQEAARMRTSADELQAELNRVSGLSPEKQKRAAKRVRQRLRQADHLEARQERLLNLGLEGLEKLGHLKDGALTEKGGWAAELCTGLVLELAEALDQHIFFELTLEELVTLVGSISGDHYREYLSIRRNPVRSELFVSLSKAVASVEREYAGARVQTEVVVQAEAGLTVLTWLEAQDWAEYSSLLRLGGVAEGDAARLISQTADHLHQLSRLYETHPDISRLASEGRRRLLRSPITDSFEE